MKYQVGDWIVTRLPRSKGWSTAKRVTKIGTLVVYTGHRGYCEPDVALASPAQIAIAKRAIEEQLAADAADKKLCASEAYQLANRIIGDGDPRRLCRVPVEMLTVIATALDGLELPS